jgi:signal transduction histidine kinase
VALVATAVLALLYAAIVAALDLAAAERLTAQVDRQLAERLAVARAHPASAFRGSGVQTNGARYGLGIYGEPIGLWRIAPSGAVMKQAPGDPSLPARLRPPQQGGTRALDAAFGTTTYRIRWTPVPGGFLLAAESLTELGHVEAVLIVAEAVAFPLLVVAFFLAALVIGLRSARPVEVARRRQLEFSADASHELRTPLSVIEAELSLACSQPRSAEEYRQVLERLRGESRRLGLIVEDLLLLARLDSEPEPPPAESVDLGHVARQAAERFSPVAARRRQSIEVEVAEGRLSLAAPPEWLAELAGSLTENACRHTPEGSRIRLSARVAEGGERLVLSVEDDGPGISGERREEVLRRFRRAPTDGGGHGLGLAIADSIARRTGGRLSIGASQLGGALVEVSWPSRRDRQRRRTRGRLRRSEADELHLG